MVRSGSVTTPEEQLIERYFAAFNRHDVDAVLACFHDDAVLVDPQGRRVEGRAGVRRRYTEEFTLMPDAHCSLRMAVGHEGRGVAESIFTATTADGAEIRAVGAEVLEFADGKIKEIRDYHQLVASALQP
jgi:taurine dehydrogenase small subunit